MVLTLFQAAVEGSLAAGYSVGPAIGGIIFQVGAPRIKIKVKDYGVQQGALMTKKMKM